MSDIAINSTLTISKGGLKRSFSDVAGFDFVASSPAVAAGVPTIGTSAHEALPMQDVSTAGWARFKNLDSTNYVQIGVDSTGTFIPMLKLKALESCVVRLATNAPYAKANTASVQLDYEIFQD